MGRFPRHAEVMIVALLMSAPVSVAAKEGFGAMVFTKKTATLTRVHPPEVYLMGTRIGVKATSQDLQDKDVAQRIKSQLESELLSNDSRLSVDPYRPQTLIDVMVTENDYRESWETRRTTERRKVGKDDKGKTIYEDFRVDVPFKTVTHHFTSTYEVTDLAQGGKLDSDAVSSNFQESFKEGTGSPNQDGLEDAAIQKVVSRVVYNVTSTRETVGVLLPKGSFERYINLAMGNLWNKYLEALAALTPRPTPADDSYRKYGMGVAYEALGYNAETEEATIKYLEQAADLYNQAIEGNPKEKYFVQAHDNIIGYKRAASPLDRVREALVSYRELKEFKESYAKTLAPPATKPAKPKGSTKPDDRDRLK